jgi:hypothetical protein
VNGGEIRVYIDEAKPCSVRSTARSAHMRSRP